MQRPAALFPAATPGDADTIDGPAAGLAALTIDFAIDWLTIGGGVALSGSVQVGTLTVAGTLVLTGLAALAAGAAVLSQGVLLAQGNAATLTVSGTLTLAGTASAVAGGSVLASAVALAGGALECDATGIVAVGGGAGMAGTVDIVAGGTLSGYGSLPGAVEDDGTLLAAGGGLGLFGAVAGTGTLAIGAGGTLFAVGPVAASLTAGFLDGTGTLELFGEAPAFAATITNFTAGDAIDIAATSILAASWAAGTLSLSAADGTVLALALAGSYAAASFVPLPDGLGGTDIQLAAAAIALPTSGAVGVAGALQLVGGGSVAGTLTASGTVALAGSVSAGALTAAGTLAILGGGLLTAGNASMTGVVLAEGAATLSVSGTVALGGTLALAGGAIASLATLTIAGGAVTLDAASALAVGIGQVLAGTLTVGRRSQLTGKGRIVAPLNVTGAVRAVGGLLALADSVVGTGSLAMGVNATLAAFGPVAVPVVKFSATSTLDLYDPLHFAGTLTGFAAGDVLDVAALTPDTVQWTPGTLSLIQAGATLATLGIAGDYTGQVWQSVADGGGGALVRLAPGGAVAPLRVGGVLSVSTALLVPSATVLAGGALLLAGGTLAAGSIAVAAGGTLSGWGSLSGALNDAGVLIASGGALSIGGAVSGGGVALIGSNATLFAPYGLSVPVTFLGDGGTLDLFGPVQDSATVANLGTTNAIDIASAIVTQALYAAIGPNLGLLTLSGPDGAVGVITLAGDVGGQNFLARPDGNGGSVIALVPCFVAGTRIATPQGERAVESLRVGDAVLTPEGPRRVRWAARRRCDARAAPELRPVRIAAGALGEGALGEGVPHRTLLLSPRHALLLGRALVPAVALVGLPGIVRVPAGVVAYHHLGLDAHSTLLAEGAVVESFLPSGAESPFDAEHGARPDPGPACAPALEGGAPLEALRRHLSHVPAPSGPAGPLLGHVERVELADGRMRLEGWALDAAEPERPVALLALRDGAACGCAVANLWRPDLDRAGLAGGRCGFVLDLPGAGGQVVLRRPADGAELPMASR